MKQAIYLTEKKAYLDIDVKVLKQNTDCNQMVKIIKDALMKEISANLPKPETTERSFKLAALTSSSDIRVKLYSYIEGKGLVLSICRPGLNDMFFYKKGTNFITVMGDPCTDEIVETISW
ncbi:MAG: hypothetical protein E7020_01410 [Alphaproteobacteria bacterium]|nr:hypothetical protein [Alphaproteobacteria bacterium]